jgi:pimeloyl-ACP methyl ester carboxylesterase
MRGYAQTSLGQVHYQHEGDHGPAVVFFHESPLSSRIFAPALPYLGRALRAFAFDTPGYGQSDAPARQPTVEEYAGWLLEAIDDLGLDRFVMTGCHTGASIGLEVARQAGPSRVTHVVLTGVPLHTPDQWEPWLTERVLGGITPAEGERSAKDVFAPDIELRRDGEHMRWAWDRLAARGRKDWPADTPIELVDMGVMQLLLAGPHYNWGYRAIWAYDPTPALDGLRCPVLLLNAAEDPLAYLDPVVAARLSDVRLVHVEGLTGQLPWRIPERYAAELIRFVTGS